MDSSLDDVASVFPFIQLPKEIRLLVWEATFKPQYILLRFVEGRRPISNIPVYAFKPYDDPKNPIALQVCRESRKISLQRYRPWNFRWYLHDRVERSKVVCRLLGGYSPRVDFFIKLVQFSISIAPESSAVTSKSYSFH